jgi:hypothetical protein
MASSSASLSPAWNKVEGKRRKSGKSGKSGKSEQLLSICIPRAHKNITSQRVRATFQRLNLGCIDNVDVVSKTTKDGEHFVTIYVHFSNWNYDNPEAKKFRDKIVKGEQVNVLYDEPWFWKCVLNRSRNNHKSSEASEAPPAPTAAAAPPPPPPLSPLRLSPLRLPRWGTADYWSLFSIVDTINAKK